MRSEITSPASKGMTIMGVFNAAGTRLAKSSVTTSTVDDPEVVVSQDLYRSVRFDAKNDGVPEGSMRENLCKGGDVVRQSVFNSWFPVATATAITPATGTTAGGTTVTITGTELDGVTAVTFGGTAGTGLSVISPTKLTVVTPAKTAGASNVVLTDDQGTVTKNNFYTYV